MRKALIAIALIAALAAAIGYVERGAIATRLMEAGLREAMQTDLVSKLPDGLTVALCGAGSPMPDPNRSGPCVLVVAGQTVLVVDAGGGSARNVNRLGVRAGAISAVFLTHFHSDHIDGLGELAMNRWVGAAHTEPLPVFGPDGVADVVAGFNAAYRLDASYRTAHHGPSVAPPQGAGLTAHAFSAPGDGSAVEVWRDGDVRVRAFAVDHRPIVPAVGYRIDYRGRSVAISGDTVKSAAVAQNAKGADLLVHEALSRPLVALINRVATEAGNASLAKITHDIPEYHTTPVEAAEIAADAGVKALLLDHIVPPLRVPGLEAVFLDGVAERYRGTVVLGRDGTLVTLPSGSAEVRVSNAF